MPRLDINYVYIKVAYEFAQLSYARRKKVGSIIVKDDQIISFGYNGTPAKFDNNCEYTYVRSEHAKAQRPEPALYELKTKNEVLHAESNAITKVAQNSGSLGCQNAVLYTTTSPCFECSKLIIQSGIKAVYFVELYEQNINSGLDLLNRANVQVFQLNMPNN